MHSSVIKIAKLELPLVGARRERVTTSTIMSTLTSSSWRSTLATVAIENRHVAKRLATRDALQRAALSLFASDGFDATSTASIAAAAGVTERTFYRHFPTKEAVLFEDYEHRLDWLASALARRPAGEDLITSVVIAVQSYPDDVEIVRRSLLSQEKAIAHLQQVQGAFAREITAHALRRLGPIDDSDLYANVAGQVLAAALVASLDVWGQRGSDDDVELERLMALGVGFLASGLADPPTTG
jgi:AcrR family transcriptional regulator